MDTLFSDLRFAFRSLRRSWPVTLVAVGSLALAIAGNTTVFAFINGLLFRPLPYAEPERLVLMGETQQQDRIEDFFSFTSAANLLDWRERARSFSGLEGIRIAPRGLGRGEEARQANGAEVTPGFFALLGADAGRGRVFAPDDGGRPLAVLAHPLWESRFGADPEVVGRTFEIDGEAHEIVGVLPHDFEFVDPSIRVFTPLEVERATADRFRRELFAVGRLAPGATTDSARAEMEAIAAELEKAYPDANRGYTASLLNLRTEVPDSRNRKLMAIIQGALVFVLLIACANLANLLLARSQGRSRELAVRASLGAGRGRLARQLLTESLLMALAAGAAGLGLGALGGRLLGSSLAGQMPSHYMPVVDHRVVAFTLAVTLLGALLCGLAPILQTARLDFVGALKDGGRGVSTGGRKKILASALVVGEITLALVLLGGVAVMIRSFLDLQFRDPGYETAHLLTVQVNLPPARYPDGEAIERVVAEMVERLEALPGVDGAAASSVVPRSPFVAGDTFYLDASPPADDQPPPRADWLTASPGYFETVGIPLVSGRRPGPGDREGAEPVVWINEKLAGRFWGDRDPLGERITFQGRSRRVVGVVGDALHGFLIGDGARPTIYVPFAQRPLPATVLVVRARVEPASLTEAVRREVQAVDPALGRPNVQSVDEFVAQFFGASRAITAILGVFGVLALFLAALGTYGVLAYAVVQRTHEIGVRMALGARRREVLTMVARRGLLLAALGIALGVPGVLAVTRVISSALSDFVPVEPWTLVSIAALLAVVTLLASLLPARRAAAVDPVEALRFE